MWNNYLIWFKNFYFVTGVTFLLYISFFSSPSLLEQFKRGKDIRELEKEKQYYLEHKQQVLDEKTNFQSDTVLLEKVAREQYYMHKNGEDVFVIEKKR